MFEENNREKKNTKKEDISFKDIYDEVVEELGGGEDEEILITSDEESRLDQEEKEKRIRELIDEVKEKEKEIEDLKIKNTALAVENDLLKDSLSELENKITNLFQEIEHKRESEYFKKTNSMFNDIDIDEHNNVYFVDKIDGDSDLKNQIRKVETGENEEKLIDDVMEMVDTEEKKHIEGDEKENKENKEVDFTALEDEFVKAVEEMEKEKEEKKEKVQVSIEEEVDKSFNGDLKEEEKDIDRENKEKNKVSFEEIQEKIDDFGNFLELDLRNYDVANIVNEIEYFKFQKLLEEEEMNELIQDKFDKVAIDLMKNDGVNLVKILNEKLDTFVGVEKSVVEEYLSKIQDNPEFQGALKVKVVEFLDYVDELEDNKVDLVPYTRIDDLLDVLSDSQREELLDDYNVKEKIKKIVKKFNSLGKKELEEKFSKFLSSEDLEDLEIKVEEEKSKEEIFEDFLNSIRDGNFDKEELKKELRRIVKENKINFTGEKKKAVKVAWLNRKKA